MNKNITANLIKLSIALAVVVVLRGSALGLYADIVRFFAAAVLATTAIYGIAARKSRQQLPHALRVADMTAAVVLVAYLVAWLGTSTLVRGIDF